MVLYLCHLTLHDNVFFASREMGTLYETEKYLHNWALSYALFESTYIPRPYRVEGKIAQQPGYLDAENEQNLLTLNGAGIYVFPALPIQWSYQVNTFNISRAIYSEKPRRFGKKGSDRNFPINYGRLKELAVGSQYRTYIIAPEQMLIPRWIRLGKWASKVRVEACPISPNQISQASGEYVCEHPLNPIDLPPSTQLRLYDRIVMPPSSLISQAKLSGSYWRITRPSQQTQTSSRSTLDGHPNQICLPREVVYGASIVVTTP